MQLPNLAKWRRFPTHEFSLWKYMFLVVYPDMIDMQYQDGSKNLEFLEWYFLKKKSR